jgi:hypothetical protein
VEKTLASELVNKTTRFVEIVDGNKITRNLDGIRAVRYLANIWILAH